MEVPTYIKAKKVGGSTIYINVALITHVISASGYCHVGVVGQSESLSVQADQEALMKAIMSARPGVY